MTCLASRTERTKKTREIAYLILNPGRSLATVFGWKVITSSKGVHGIALSADRGPSYGFNFFLLSPQ